MKHYTTNAMTKIFLFLIAVLFLIACKNEPDKGKFTITGEIKNAPDQKIYLEELFFSQKDPEVLDTADMKKGKFTLTALAAEEGLFRIRLANNNTGFIFINDQQTILFSADLKDLSLQGPTFKSAANNSLKKFINAVDSQRTLLQEQDDKLKQLELQNATDSLQQLAQQSLDEKTANSRNYIIKYIDTTTDPVMALFALGYTRNIDPSLLDKPISSLSKRFPKHQAVMAVITQYNQLMAQYKATPHEGGTAPDINMPDTSGKPFALSSLRGKYVLVDFWASWCGPCRAENPNVVNAYNTFKSKNFTVLGVSLDNNKDAWLKAIATDSLTWYHISDLKQWESSAVGLYGFESIPYNVLVDPAGKIIALNLRGADLQNKLADLLK